MKKILLSFLFSVVCIVPSMAQPIYKPVRLTLNSNDGIYAKGDSVKIYASVGEDADSELLLTVSEYGREIKRETIYLPAGESLLFAGTFNESTSTMYKLGPASDPKEGTSIGFLVEPDKFTPGFDVPDDLDEFWNRQVKAMRKGKMKVKITDPVGMKPKDEDDMICYHIEISMPEGNPVRGYVAYPANAEKKSLPIFLYVHSAGVNKPQNRAKAEIACKYARQGGGCIAMDLNAHGMLDDQPQQYYDDLFNGELKDCTSPKTVDGHESFYFRLMYLRMVRAIDYLVKLPVWDGERLMVYGASQGGGQTLAISGIDPRVTHACAIVPAMTDTGAALQKRKGGWPSGANNRNCKTESGRAVMPYYDGAVLVSRFKGKLYIEAGNVDLTCDPACVSAAYNNAANAESKEIHYYPYRPHSSLDPVYNQDWKKKVDSNRERFYDSFFKGE